MTNPLNQPLDPFSSMSPQQKKEYMNAVNELKLKLDQAVLSVFNSTEGEHLLELWDDHFVRQPVIMLGAPDQANAMREGRNAFIRTIRETVNRARGIK